MYKFAVFFREKFKPWFMYISKYIGLISIYTLIAFLVHVFIGLNIYIPAIVIIFALIGFLVDRWAKITILDKRIEELVNEEIFLNNISIDNIHNRIDNQVFLGLVTKIENKLFEEGFYDDDYIGSSDSEVDKHEKSGEIHNKIIDIVKRKIYLINYHKISR